MACDYARHVRSVNPSQHAEAAAQNMYDHAHAVAIIGSACAVTINFEHLQLQTEAFHLAQTSLALGPN